MTFHLFSTNVIVYLPFTDTGIHQRSFISGISTNYHQYICILEKKMSKTMRHDFNVKQNYDKETANSFCDKNITCKFFVYSGTIKV